MGLSIPDLDPDTDTITAALAYAKAGWYVLPVNRGTKHPGSVLGKGWPAKSSRDPQQIVAWFAGSNDGLALHCGRSGAVVFDVDRPENIPPTLQEEIEQAKPPAQASRRGNDQRAHYLFAQPDGRSIGNGGGKLGTAWGEVRGRNGVIVVAPTPHSKPDGLYRWLHTGSLPVLSPRVATLLPDQANTEDAATDAEIDAFLARHTTSLRPELIEGVVTSLRADIERGGGRHPSAITAVCWALREAQAGLYDARAALAALWPIFRDSLRGEPGRTPAAEWRGIVAWAIGQASLDNPDATRAKLTASEPFSADACPDTPGHTPAVSDRPLRRGDFTDIRNRKRAEPEFMRRDDGKALLYPAKDSYLYAETESGKSWLAALTVVQCVTNGIPVIVYDFEEGDELEYGSRLLALGLGEHRLNDASLFRYIMIDGRCSAEMMAEADDMGARVVVNEGMSVAYDVFGWAVKENDSATAFRRILVKPHLAAGRAVLTTDHVVKDRETRGRYAIGGVMKLNAASGGAFLLVNVEGLAPGRRGASNLYVTKDRPGGVKRHGVPAGDKFDPQVKRIGTLVVDDSRAVVNYLDVRVLPPAPSDASTESPLAVQVLDAIDAIHGSGQAASLRKIRAEVGARGTAVDQELDRLVTAGTLAESLGRGNARVFDRVRRSTIEEGK